VIELATRRMQILGSTPHPDETFMRLFARTLTMADAGGCRVLICDRMRSGARPRQCLSDSGIRIVQTPL
jgi:hypothetical protein